MVTPANALKFSMWLASQHPRAFAAVLEHVSPPTARRANRPGLGNTFARAPTRATPGAWKAPVYDYRGRRDSNPNFARGRFGGVRANRVGTLGDDIPEVTVMPSAPDANPDLNTIPDSTFADPTLQDINVSIPDTNFDLGAASAASDTSGGFWSNIGGGLASIGGGLASAVGAVAQAVTNPQVLSSAGSLAATVIKSNAQTQQAQQLANMQTAVLQAQQSRTLSGAGALPVTYRINPATGQTQPYYYNAATGQYSPAGSNSFGAPGGFATSGFASSLGLSSGLAQYLPYLLIGGGLLLVLTLSRR